MCQGLSRVLYANLYSYLYESFCEWREMKGAEREQGSNPGCHQLTLTLDSYHGFLIFRMKRTGS